MRTIVVSAAVIERAGTFLITRRQAGIHLEGQWEFPGGKCEPDESLEACMTREIREELAVGVEVGDEILSTSHEYPDRLVELHFLRCTLLGTPVPQQGQEMRWAPREQLALLEFPPADARLIRMLTGPD